MDYKIVLMRDAEEEFDRLSHIFCLKRKVSRLQEIY